ncbi:hypothetical protein UQ17_27825, partial [Escherichia coli]
ISHAGFRRDDVVLLWCLEGPGAQTAVQVGSASAAEDGDKRHPIRDARWISDWNDCEFAEILIISSRNVAIHLSPGKKKPATAGFHHYL